MDEETLYFPVDYVAWFIEVVKYCFTPEQYSTSGLNIPSRFVDRTRKYRAKDKALSVKDNMRMNQYFKAIGQEEREIYYRQRFNDPEPGSVSHNFFASTRDDFSNNFNLKIAGQRKGQRQERRRGKGQDDQSSRTGNWKGRSQAR